MNPLGCRTAVEKRRRSWAWLRVKVAVVLGGDLFPRSTRCSHQASLDMDTGQPLADVRPRVLSANAYA